jgi:hypothetical protein
MSIGHNFWFLFSVEKEDVSIMTNSPMMKI